MTDELRGTGAHRLEPAESRPWRIALVCGAFLAAVAGWLWTGGAVFGIPVRRLVPLVSIGGTAYFAIALLLGFVIAMLVRDVILAVEQSVA